MSDVRKSYTVTLAGIEHTVLLSPEDAERFGARAVPVKAVAAPANKARAVSNKSD